MANIIAHNKQSLIHTPHKSVLMKKTNLATKLYTYLTIYGVGGLRCMESHSHEEVRILVSIQAIL